MEPKNCVKSTCHRKAMHLGDKKKQLRPMSRAEERKSPQEMRH